MLLIWLGMLLVIAGLLYMAARTIWGGRLSARRARSATDATLEPREPGAGLGLAAHWPGFALVALGALLLLIGAFA